MFTLALYLRLFGHVPFLRWACKSPIDFFCQLCPRSNDYIKPLIWAHNWFSLSVSNSNILEGLNTSESYCHCASLSLYMTWLYGKSLMFKESEIPKSISCLGITALWHGSWDDITTLPDPRCKMCHCEHKKVSFDCL